VVPTTLTISNLSVVHVIRANTLKALIIVLFMNRSVGLKRGGFLKRKTPLRANGKSDTALTREHIQAELRRIVIERDGGCIFQKPLMDGRSLGIPYCGGYAKDGHLILQADHLLTRANSATFADPRLVVAVCKAHHGWKSLGSNRNKAQYDAAVRAILPADRVALWDACEKDSWRPHRTYASDWALELAYLKTL
jgi:hypothetical protein